MLPPIARIEIMNGELAVEQAHDASIRRHRAQGANDVHTSMTLGQHDSIAGLIERVRARTHDAAPRRHPSEECGRSSRDLRRTGH